MGVGGSASDIGARVGACGEERSNRLVEFSPIHKVVHPSAEHELAEAVKADQRRASFHVSKI